MEANMDSNQPTGSEPGIPSPSNLEPPAAVNTPPKIWNGTDVWIISLGALLIFVVGLIGIQLLVQKSNLPYLEAGKPTLALSVALLALEGAALAGSFYFLGVRRRGLSWQEAGLAWPPPFWISAGLIAGAIAIPFTGLIAILIQAVLGLPMENPQIPVLAPEGFSWMGLFSMLLLGGILVPIAEELYFRGVLFSWMQSRWGFWIGAIVSGIIFGALHGNIALAGATSLLGVVLAWVTARSRSLWPPIIIHAVHNSIQIVFLYAILAFGGKIAGM